MISDLPSRCLCAAKIQLGQTQLSLPHALDPDHSYRWVIGQEDVVGVGQSLQQVRSTSPAKIMAALSPLTAWIAHRGARKGAAVAFYTLFSMTPILVLAIAVAGNFFGEEAAQGKIIAQMQALVGPNGAHAINALLAAARNPESSVMASAIATVLLMLGSTSVFVELKDSLDEIWGTGNPQAPSFSVGITNSAFAFWIGADFSVFITGIVGHQCSP